MVRCSNVVHLAGGALVSVLLCVWLCGCSDMPRPAASDAPHHEPELADAMIRMQHYTQKLGYAINAENAELAEFYHHELEETTESIIAEIPIYEGYEIASLTQQMFLPTLEAQHDSLASRQWSAARDDFATLINSCNACHMVTDHGFIVMTEVEGKPPFNQRFDPDAD